MTPSCKWPIVQICAQHRAFSFETGEAAQSCSNMAATRILENEKILGTRLSLTRHTYLRTVKTVI